MEKNSVRSKKEKAVIYARCASLSEKDSCVDRQSKACLKYATWNGYSVGKDDVYVDIGAGGTTDEDRPSFHAMMRRLESDLEIKAVIVYDISRLFRNLALYLTYKEKLDTLGKKIVSVAEPFIGNDSPAGRLIESTLGMFAEFRNGRRGTSRK